MPSTSTNKKYLQNKSAQKLSISSRVRQYKYVRSAFGSSLHLFQKSGFGLDFSQGCGCPSIQFAITNPALATGNLTQASTHVPGAGFLDKSSLLRCGSAP